MLLQNQEGFLFASEKIFTVLAVVLIIFAVIVGFLVMLERRVRKVEKQADEIAGTNQNQNE